MDAVELLYRIAKGEPLTDLELDDNFRKLKTAVNYLLGEIAISTTSSAIRGEMKMFAGASLPVGYLWCNGAAVSRTTYADLFAIVGTKFGVGNGTTTFNLPDFRGASPMGSNPMGAATKGGISARTDGAIVGAETANADHDHTATGTLDIDPINYTPTGTISIASYTGNVTPTITTTINAVTLSTTPSGSVTSATTIGSVSPTIDVDGEACSKIKQGSEAETNLMNCVALTINTDTLVSSIDASTTSGFLGTEDDLGHSHTASSVSSVISLNHGHSGTFTGGAATLTPTGVADVTVNSKTLAVSTIQPSQVCNFIIKY